MQHEVQVMASPELDAASAANYVAQRARAAVVGHGRFTAAEVVPMPENAADIEAIAADYAAVLPQRFHLIHLGLGPDGHTASLVPEDPVLAVTDRLVTITGPYQGHRRMTLTCPALADQLLRLVTGEDKKVPLARLLAGDGSIPAGRVQTARSLVIADRASAGSPPWPVATLTP